MSRMDGWITDLETVDLYRVGEADHEGRVDLFGDLAEAERAALDTGAKIYICRYALVKVEEYIP